MRDDRRPSRTSLAAEAIAHSTPISRSFRFHRPRSAFCGRGYCGLCEVETPTGRALACRTPAEGIVLRRRDPARVLGVLAERYPPWFYERRWLRHASALRLLRRLSTAGRLGGSGAAVASKEWRDEQVETAVVGDGGNVDGVPVGVYEGKVLGVVREDALVALSFDRLVLATGSYDVPPPVPGNDLPGVIGVGALEEYAPQGALRRGLRVAIWGPRERAARAAEIAAAYGAEVVWQSDRAPRLITGRGRVRAVDGNACDLFVTAVAQPALELAAQAGARLALADDGLPVIVARDVPAWLELRGDAAAPSSGVPQVAVADAAFTCLCEDVRARDVRRAIADGFDHPELVKRRTGAITGPCQGKLCAAAVLALLREAGRRHEPTTSRPPAASLTLAELAARA